MIFRVYPSLVFLAIVVANGVLIIFACVSDIIYVLCNGNDLLGIRGVFVRVYVKLSITVDLYVVCRVYSVRCGKYVIAAAVDNYGALLIAFGGDLGIGGRYCISLARNKGSVAGFKLDFVVAF